MKKKEIHGKILEENTFPPKSKYLMKTKIFLSFPIKPKKLKGLDFKTILRHLKQK